MNKRINDKIIQIKIYIKEFKTIIPDSFADYINNIEKKAACERYIEKIVEASTDLAFLIIKLKKFRIPEDDADAFNIIFENNIISKDLCSKLKKAKGMRNILAHQYGKIDDELIFESMKKELLKDINEFVDVVKSLN